ncbi:MAG TPA: VRR-NUC domain-containing protein [Nocardioides sp.]
MTATRSVPLYHPTLSEADFTTWVIQTAQWHGWMASHFRTARTAQGWRTALEGHKGFPDVVLARDGEVIFAELKTDTGRIRPDQKKWLAELGPAAVVWRPRDRDTVLARLSTPRTAQPAQENR